MQQGRWVSYIYRYRDNKRCENAGFIKVSKIFDTNKNYAKIQIGLKLCKNENSHYYVYLMRKENHEETISIKQIDTIEIPANERDIVIRKKELDWNDPLMEGRSMEFYDGLFILCEDGEYLLGMWNEYEVKRENIAVKEKISYEKPDIPQMDKLVPEETVEEENILEQMLESYPKLPIFPNSQIKKGVRMKPYDIGKLPMDNWKLGENSFLSHGYYHYRYIMLGIVMLNEEEKTVIGVPGVFNNQEKYMANMFGFQTFIPVKRNDLLTGNFGYWIFEISNV